MAVDNEWNYTGVANYKNYIDGTSDVGGITYYNIKNDQGGNSLMTKSGRDYYIIDKALYGDNDRHLFLKEAGSEGDTWNFEISVSNFGMVTTNKYTFSIFGKLPAHTVGGTNYTDVLVIDNDLDVYADGMYFYSLNDSRYYYAKGVGLIQSKISGQTSNLTDYTVK